MCEILICMTMIKISVYPVLDNDGYIIGTRKNVLLFGICILTKTIEAPCRSRVDDFYYYQSI